MPTNFVRSGPGKTDGIWYRLRLIDSAKGQWGFEHGRGREAVPTKEDLYPYLGHIDGGADGWIKPVAGERYSVRSLAETPQAELTRELEGKPKGTLLRLGTNGEETTVLPGKPH